MSSRIQKLFSSFLILALALALMPVQFSAGAAPSTTLVINEIDYDQPGTDTTEFIELKNIGTESANLSEYSLELINGANGSVYYNFVNIGIGSLAAGDYLVLCGNFAAVTNCDVDALVPTDFIQNGAPDAVALFHNDVLIDAVSYEGDTAGYTEGSGVGLVDDGTIDNAGISRFPDGTDTDQNNVDFSLRCSTPGEANIVESSNCVPPNTNLVINEIDYDQPGTDGSEFVEIRNNGDIPTDLTGWTLELVNGNGGAIYSSFDLSGYILSADDYFVVCGDAANVTNCDLDVSPDTNLIQNGAPDAVGLRYNGTLIDAVSYEGDTAGYTEGSGVGLEDNSGVENAGISRFPDGVDTDQNNVDFSFRCSTPGTANVADSSNCVLASTELVINEIDYDQPGTDTAEFVEIKNNGVTDADLTGWILELVNGNGGGVYSIIDLSGNTISAGGYFVVCANAATVANCDLDVTPDTNLIQNGAPDAVGLRFNGTLVDAVSYEGDTVAPYTEGSGVGLEDNGDGSIGRCPDGNDTNQNNVDFVFATATTPGTENGCAPPPPAEMCGDPFTPIYVVQGNGAASPLAGTDVAIEGIVIGDFQNNASPDNGDFNGFHIQDPTGDGDVTTSDGIFVYAPGGMDVSVGDAVRVRGSVSEYNGLTEIGASQIWKCSTGNPLPAPAELSLPVTSVDDFEVYEGMYVTFPQGLVISEYFNFDRFGEIVLTSERHLTPTAEYEPGLDAIQAAQNFLLDRITLDDGRSTQNPDPAIHPNGADFTLDNRFRGGDIVQNVTGVMDYSFGLYRIQPTQGADYSPANPRPAQPDDVGGNLKVASFNVLNYFTTIDTGAFICGPAQDQECRGADDANEFTRQRDKIIAALTEIDADVVGLIEIENNLNDDAVIDLVNGLNAAYGYSAYDYVSTGVIGTDAIKVALIYKPASVSLVGGYALLDSSVDSRFIDTKNRPALAQTFMDSNTGGIFTVAVNHLKSKGSDCNDVGDPDTGDGAGNCNATRTLAAQALVDWLASDPTGSGDADFLIIGDLNSYDKEDPIDAILAGGYTDLVNQYLGGGAYSYVFDGQTGYLDHALANADLVDEMTGVTIWHINADEPDLIDYDTSFKAPNQAAIYAPDAYRSSDHDPVIIGLDVCDEIAPTFDELSVSPDTLWPVNHKYVDVTATVIISDNFDPAPTVTLDSVTSNEPDNGLGDGDTENDIVIVDNFHFQLRAERSGTGEGRVYTITYTVTDDCGNSTTQSVMVTVPKSQGKKK